MFVTINYSISQDKLKQWNHFPVLDFIGLCAKNNHIMKGLNKSGNIENLDFSQRISFYGAMSEIKRRLEPNKKKKHRFKRGYLNPEDGRFLPDRIIGKNNECFKDTGKNMALKRIIIKKLNKGVSKKGNELKWRR